MQVIQKNLIEAIATVAVAVVLGWLLIRSGYQPKPGVESDLRVPPTQSFGAIRSTTNTVSHVCENPNDQWLSKRQDCSGAMVTRD